MEIRIRVKREAKGLTQQDLAKRVGVSKTSLCRWENWKEGMSPPTLRTLQRVANALGSKIKDLFEE